MKGNKLIGFGAVFCFAGLFALVYFPSLDLNYSLLDDGLTVLISKQIWSYLFSLEFRPLVNSLLEPDAGRVRPVYWIIQAIVNLGGMYNPSLVHAIRIGILVISNYFMYIFLKKLKVDKVWILLGIFIYNFDSLIFENYYRLGPSEPFMALFILITLYLVFYSSRNLGNTVLTIILCGLGALTKETYFLLFVPLLCTLVINFKFNLLRRLQKIRVLLASISLIVFGAVTFLIKGSYNTIGTYTSQYEVTFERLLSSLLAYKNQLLMYHSPFIYLALFYLCFVIYKLFKKRSLKVDFNTLILLVCWLGALSQLFILLPWKFALGRYLIIVNLFLVFVYAVTLQNVFGMFISYLRKYVSSFKIKPESLKVVFVIFLTPLFLVRNIFPIANFQLWQKTDSEFTADLLYSLSTRIPKNETVLVNYEKGDSNIEIFLETKWHMDLFFNRTDLNFDYLDQNNICAKSDRYLLDRTSSRFVNKELLGQISHLEKVDTGEKTYRPLNYGGVRDSFISGSKSNYWDSSYLFDWTIFKQPGGTCISTKQN